VLQENFVSLGDQDNSNLSGIEVSQTKKLKPNNELGFDYGKKQKLNLFFQ
jgi:hypothetical protein